MKKQRYELSELIKRWEREEITTEQAIGQLLLWQVVLSEKLNQLEIHLKRFNNVR